MIEKQKYLYGQKVLVVEDEYFLADELKDLLENAGATVIGPVATSIAALELLASGQKPDLAVLDIDLQGRSVYAVSDALAARNIPFVFATGFDGSAIAERYRHVLRVEKPYANLSFHSLLRDLIQDRLTPPSV